MLPQRGKRFKSTEHERCSRQLGFGGYEYKYNTTDTDDNTTARDLTWRADSKQSLSDWTIELKCEDDDGGGTVTSFHTHKCVLAAGKYRSDYFRGLFQNTTTTREMNSSTSTISLKASSFEAFPEMLDHVYTGACRIKTENSVALLFLSNYFGIATLFKDAKTFIESDMEQSNVHIYLTEAAIYEDDVVLNVAKVMCAEYFGILSAEQICKLTPDLLKLVLGADELYNPNNPVVCLQVASYCRHHPELLNASLLAEITNAKVMPRIHPSEAMFFLSLCAQHQSNGCLFSEDSNGLRARCIEAIQNWQVAFDRSILSEKKDDISRVPDDSYYNLPDAIKIEVTEEALRSAKREISQLSEVMEENLSEHSCQLYTIRSEMKALKRLHSEEKARLRSNFSSLIQRLKQEHSKEKARLHSNVSSERAQRRNMGVGSRTRSRFPY